MVKFRKVHENVLYEAHTRARFVHGQGARGFITYEVVWRPRSGRSELAKRARQVIAHRRSSRNRKMFVTRCAASGALAKRASNSRQVIAHRRSRQVIITPGKCRAASAGTAKYARYRFLGNADGSSA